MPSDFKFVRGKEGNEAADTSEANFNDNYMSFTGEDAYEAKIYFTEKT